MDYCVSGITFKKNELSIKMFGELKAGSISRGHLFYVTKMGKPYLLLRAGDFIEKEFINKYKDKGMDSFYFLEVATEEAITVYKDFFLKLNKLRKEGDRRSIRDEIFCKVHDDFVIGEEYSYLNFVIATFECYYNLPISVVEKFQSTSLTLYTRALLTSSFSYLISFLNGVTDPLFLKDTYNISFCLDYGLLESDDFTFTLAQASEKERNNPGMGIDFLTTQNINQEEIDLFIQHPNISVALLDKHKESFTYPEIINTVRFHHEKIDGSGFPEGLCYSSISNYETSITLADSLASFEEYIFTKGDGKEVFWNKVVEVDQSDNIKQLPIEKLLRRFIVLLKTAEKPYVGTAEGGTRD